MDEAKKTRSQVSDALSCWFVCCPGDSLFATARVVSPFPPRLLFRQEKGVEEALAESRRIERDVAVKQRKVGACRRFIVVTRSANGALAVGSRGLRVWVARGEATG